MRTSIMLLALANLVWLLFAAFMSVKTFGDVEGTFGGRSLWLLAAVNFTVLAACLLPGRLGGSNGEKHCKEEI